MNDTNRTAEEWMKAYSNLYRYTQWMNKVRDLFTWANIPIPEAKDYILHHDLGYQPETLFYEFTGISVVTSKIYLRRDDVLIAGFVDDSSFVKYMHQKHSYSIHHALKYEGYSVETENERKIRMA